MMNFLELPCAPSNHLVPVTGQLRQAVAAYLARFRGSDYAHDRSSMALRTNAHIIQV
jgi:hypothetical protein